MRHPQSTIQASSTATVRPTTLPRARSHVGKSLAVQPTTRTNACEGVSPGLVEVGHAGVLRDIRTAAELPHQELCVCRANQLLPQVELRKDIAGPIDSAAQTDLTNSTPLDSPRLHASALMLLVQRVRIKHATGTGAWS